MKNFMSLVIAIIVLASCEDSQEIISDDIISDSVIVVDTTPDDVVLGSGVFTSYAHGLMGKATVVSDDSGKRKLRFEDFTMSAGPDVHVYFSKSNNFSNANVVEVDVLRDGYNGQSIEFTTELEDIGIADDHDFVLVYCVQYNSLFGYAEIKK